MKAWTWNIFCAASLLILCTSVVLWIRGWLVKEVLWREDVVTGLAQTRAVEPVSLNGFSFIDYTRDARTKAFLEKMRLEASKRLSKVTLQRVSLAS